MVLGHREQLNISQDSLHERRLSSRSCWPAKTGAVHQASREHRSPALCEQLIFGEVSSVHFPRNARFRLHQRCCFQSALQRRKSLRMRAHTRGEASFCMY